jgi:hypothetical protein
MRVYLKKFVSGQVTLIFALACFALSPHARAVCREGCDLNELNTFLGEDALLINTTGTNNTAIGAFALHFNTTGNSNTAIGSGTLYYNSTGVENTAIGAAALLQNTEGFYNTATGVGALTYNTTGSANTANGYWALDFNTTGNYNTATGQYALTYNTTGELNTANGYVTLFSNTTGSGNTAIGVGALTSNTTGHNNVALGPGAGGRLTTGSDNIDIGNYGVPGESGTIRIGTTGHHNHAVIAGIYGTTIGTGVSVMVSPEGRLGTVTSSARYKDAIEPMDKSSEVILSLKPVTFHYKKEIDPKSIPQFGLVAEQVEKVNPDLVARDEQGKPYTVRYEAVNAMLLNEFLKEHRKNEAQGATIAQQDRKIQEQEATITQLKKEMKTVVARLEEQAAQIQKVSAHVGLNKTASQIVLNNQ